MASDGAVAFSGCCLLVLVITSVTLFGVSFDTVEPTEAGLKYNNNLKSLDRSRIYHNGRYFVGLGLSLITFPMNLQSVTFAGNTSSGTQLKCWSREGQVVLVDLNFRYRLDRRRIADMYMRYQENWADTISRISAQVIKEVSIKYTAAEFFLLRETIGKDMKTTLSARLAQEFIVLDVFNLWELNIPDLFEAKVVTKVIQAQLEKTELNRKQSALLRAQIAVIQGQGDAGVNLVLANAQSARNRTVEYAKADSFKQIRSQEATSYQLLENALGLNSTSLLQYRSAQTPTRIDTSRTNTKFSVGFNNPIYSLS